MKLIFHPSSFGNESNMSFFSIFSIIFPPTSIFTSVDFHNHMLPKVAIAVSKAGHCPEAPTDVGVLQLPSLRSKTRAKLEKNRFSQFFLLDHHVG